MDLSKVGCRKTRTVGSFTPKTAIFGLTLPVEEISRSCKEHENYFILNLTWKHPAYKLVNRAMVWKDQKMT